MTQFWFGAAFKESNSKFTVLRNLAGAISNILCLTYDYVTDTLFEIFGCAKPHGRSGILNFFWQQMHDTRAAAQLQHEPQSALQQAES